MIPKELAAKILRFHQVEKWSIGTIAQHLMVHHSVVERVIAKGIGSVRKSKPRRRKIDPYLPFIQEKLRQFPKLVASVLYRMCLVRGYRGSERQLRHIVSGIRPRPQAEAYLRLRTFPGEQGQVDWAHFGQVKVDGGIRKLYAFVMVLSFCRRIFLRFFFGMSTDNFLCGHQEAFHFFAGVPRTVLYDNLKSCVLERYGDAIRFNPRMLDFAARYRFEPHPVGRARGNEKGRVERAIRYARQSFFMVCKWRDLQDLNDQARAWCNGPVMQRPWPEDHRKTVAEVFMEEKEHLLPLPETEDPIEERCEVSVGKTPYARFDGNDYSVPHDGVQRTLIVLATEARVRILDGTKVVAEHERSWSKGEQIEDPKHLERLIREKRRARKHRGYDRLYHAAPSTRELQRRLAEKGENLGAATSRLLKMLDRYGAEALEGAVREALARDVPHPSTVAILLEKSRQDKNVPPPLAVVLPDNPAIRDLAVEPHSLEQYDEISQEKEEEEE